MRMNKRFTNLLFTLVVLFNLSSFSSASPVDYVDRSEKVYDFAQKLSSQEESIIFQTITDMIARYRLDFAVVITNDNAGLGYADYADDFYDYNGFGYGPNDDGLLFLIDLDDGYLYMSTFAKAHRYYFNDAAIDHLIDEAYYYATDGLYYKSILAFLEAAGTHIEWVDANPNKEFTSTKDYILIPAGIAGLVYRFNYAHTYYHVEIFAFTALTSLCIFVVLYTWHKSSLSGSPSASIYAAGNYQVTRAVDRFLHSNTIATSKQSSSSGSGGTSSRTSSSGRSHGGGGRRL